MASWGACLIIVNLLRRGCTTYPRETSVCRVPRCVGSVEDMRRNTLRYCALRALGAVEQSRDIPRRFREHGRISEDLERRWIRMIGFRNILVHEYVDVDVNVDSNIVHDAVQNRLADLNDLKQAFAGFL